MYLDPGFGGMLVQVIVVIAAVGGGLLFSLRKKIRQLFFKDKAKPQPMNVSNTSDDAVDVLDNETK
jgi:hypothetical protein